MYGGKGIMKTWQAVQSVCFAGIVSSTLYLVYCFYIFSHSNAITSIIHSPYISAQTQQEVTEQVLAFTKISRNNTRLHSLLQKKFPAIISITCNSFIPGHLKLNVVYDTPLMIIKENYEAPMVLTKKGCYATLSCYQEDAVQTLPTLIVTQKGGLDYSRDTLYRWICSLPEEFTQRYYIFWESPYKIVIHDTQQTEFTYIVTSQTDLKLLQTTNIVRMQQTIHKKQINKKYKKWHIDLRFQDLYIAQGIL